MPVPGDVTTARSVYSPVFTCAGAVTWKRAESDSSSCAKLDGHAGGRGLPPGRQFQRHGGLRRALGAIGHGDVNLALHRPALPAADGITASGGVTRTEKAGTTFSSIRLSP